ncbi:MAG: c-type cytochrome [Blastocatellia bacterium]|nr:c-type cytochrome [Chloracidobacterium sp.]MBL8185450.1 c-type cytochrome [Blastocatellia bacterium]HRJ88661.1 c-type cytochrome [Pyrinomonadaceae bacterium]HRK49002.1 c-type cytochrome [Pyrinomonadaceae bacterium]
MRKRKSWVMNGLIAAVLSTLGTAMFSPVPVIERSLFVQAEPSPSPLPEFDQAAELAKLREAIKGKENERAETVFKNLQMTSMKAMPAARILAIMEFGYSRSLGVNCTHCHTAGRYEAEDKPQKQIAREMARMVTDLNGTTLKGIKNLKSSSPAVNCTTCHRGEIKPALNLGQRN